MDGRSRRHAGRRDALVVAASDYTFAHRLADLSLRPVADALGVSHRTLLHHFGTKERLVIAILREIRVRERLLLAAALHERLAAGMRRTWERFAAPPHEGFFRLYFEVQGLALRDPVTYAATSTAWSRTGSTRSRHCSSATAWRSHGRAPWRRSSSPLPGDSCSIC